MPVERITNQNSKQNTKNISSAISSQQISAKTYISSVWTSAISYLIPKTMGFSHYNYYIRFFLIWECNTLSCSHPHIEYFLRFYFCRRQISHKSLNIFYKHTEFNSHAYIQTNRNKTCKQAAVHANLQQTITKTRSHKHPWVIL